MNQDQILGVIVVAVAVGWIAWLNRESWTGWIASRGDEDEFMNPDEKAYPGGADDKPPPGAVRWATAIRDALSDASSETFEDAILDGTTQFAAAKLRIQEKEAQVILPDPELSTLDIPETVVPS